MLRKTARSQALRLALLAALAPVATPSPGAEIRWERKSTKAGALEIPNPGTQQTCCVVADFDGDGIADFAIGERTKTPSVVWYRWNSKGWTRRVIEPERLAPEAGGAAADLDGDGDPDLVLGQDWSGNAMWWWENPRPEFGSPWNRRFVKNSGGPKHHDQTIGDFDGDGRPELVSWNQGARQLLWFEIPAEPRSRGPWSYAGIYRWEGGQELEGFPSIPVDVDGDGKVDIVGGGRWFRHKGGLEFEAEIVDDGMRFTQCAAGQLVEGGWAEIVFSPGDADGVAKWYERTDGKWKARELRSVIHGHTCEVRDVDGDGHLDILIGEMGNPGAGDAARTFLWFGDGRGNFVETAASAGQGIHEGQVADFDGDRRLDILMKPYSHNAPRVDVLLQRR